MKGNEIDKSQFVIVYCTVPDKPSGQKIAEAIVKEGLCACVNRIPGVTSHYIYGGEYFEETEELLVIKTTSEAFERMKDRIESLHPYDVPEIIATAVSDGSESYLEWVQSSVR